MATLTDRESGGIVWAAASASTRRGRIGRQYPRGLAFVAVAAGLLCFRFPANAADQAPTPVVLDNEHVRIEVDPGNGAITRICDKQGQIQLLPADGLADNFRLVLRGADKADRLYQVVPSGGEGNPSKGLTPSQSLTYI